MAKKMPIVPQTRINIFAEPTVLSVKGELGTGS